MKLCAARGAAVFNIALLCAAQHGQIEAAELCVAWGADVGRALSGRTVPPGIQAWQAEVASGARAVLPQELPASGDSPAGFRFAD